MKLIQYFPFILVAIIISCTKPPDYPIEPVIEFERLNKNVMVQSQEKTDSVVVTFSFTDGDGDLGHNDSIQDIFLKDIRFPEAEGLNPIPFKLPFVPVQGVGNGISGEISVLTYTSCCTYPPGTFLPCDTTAYTQFPTDTLIYEIYIKDRAGNESNRILTAPIILNCNVN